MAKKSHQLQSNQFAPGEQPRRFLTFIELAAFVKRWENLGLDDEGDLWSLQNAIMANPHAGKVIQGTDGLRKTRFAPPTWNVGASGATRVLYVLFEETRIAVLALIYAKNEAENISAGVKQQLNVMIAETRRGLERRRTRQ